MYVHTYTLFDCCLTISNFTDFVITPYFFFKRWLYNFLFYLVYNAALKLRMTVRRPSLWQFINVLVLEETGVRVKLAQIEGGILKSNQTASSNSTDTIQITQNIIDINKNLSMKKISMNGALIELSRLIGLKYQKFRDERRKKKAAQQRW